MFVITSAAFANGAEIPARHTCEGEQLSPPLEWSGAPKGTRSFVLIVDDPDAPDPAAPQRVWVHWLLYNLPPDTTSLAEGASRTGLPEGARELRNDGDGVGYTGPCPPIGRHRYFHRIYALDTILPDLGEDATRADLEKAMEGHVLGMAELMGTYPARD
jgi:Raf kinase inhibitor-like YbhB/YbcL family protein